MTSGRQWDDPATWSDWIARLAEQLVQRDLQYIGLKGIERMKLDPDDIGNVELANSDPGANATLTAAAAVNDIVKALREIPTFQTGWGIATLRDVAVSLADVDAGGRPRLFQPRPEQKAPKIGVGQRTLMATVVLCVELLKASGQGEMEACSYVATTFSAVGHKGRKGAPIGPKTVWEWSAKSGNDIKMRVIIDQGLGQWRVDRGWPPQRPAVENLIRSKSLDPFLLAQI